MSSKFLRHAQIPLIGVRPLQVRICKPGGLVKRGGAGNRRQGPLAERVFCENIRQTRNRVGVAGTELVQARPGAFEVLRRLSDGSPVIVESPVAGTEHRSITELIGETDARLEVG